MRLSQQGEKLITELMEAELDKGTFPGAVLGIVNRDEFIYQKSFGCTSLAADAVRVADNTLFDLASLTKVIVTTTIIMQLIEQGRLNLWDYLREYFPEAPADKSEITIFHLLTHTSGYQAIVRLWEQEFSYDDKINYILNLKLESRTGQRVIYSDPNFILLGELIRRVTGREINQVAADNLFAPLSMKSTAFNPLTSLQVDGRDIAATERCSWRERMLVGEVHDENCASLGGVSGHAGLFSTIGDLSRFVRMLLNQGSFAGVRLLSRPTVRLVNQDWTNKLTEHRGLGWDLLNNFRSSGGVLFSPGAFGHTGFTGTSIWIDPQAGLGVILLTNRVHPTRENVKIISLRPRLHNLINSLLN